MTITLPPPFVPGHATLRLGFMPNCDVCYGSGRKQRATFDARIPGQTWGYLCTRHFIYFDCNTGTGKGQALIDGRQFDEETLERIRLMNRGN